MVADKIFAARCDGRDRAAERNLSRPQVLGRVLAGFVMGGLTLGLIGLAVAIGPMAALLLVQLILPVAMIATVLVVSLASTARAAWGRLCLINGIMSIALAAASVQCRGQPLWPTDPGYERALDQAIQWWVGHVIWSAAAYFGGAIFVATVLFALSYWLLRSPHGLHRHAH